MCPEEGCKLLHGHALGIGSQQRGSIRGVQTGLRLTRISDHRAALIDTLGSLGTWPSESTCGHGNSEN